MTWEEEIAGHRQDVAAIHAVLRRTPRSDLRWVTVVHCAFVARLSDDTATLMRDAAARLSADWREVLMAGGRIRRDPRGHTRWAGVVELDLLHPKLVCSHMKAKLLAGFGIDVTKIQMNSRIVLLHTHMIIDGRGHPSWSIIDRDLRMKWSNGPRQVHIAKIYEEGTVGENIDQLTSYSVKFKFLYSRAWLGRKTEYTSVEYEPAWREYIKNAYRTIGLDKLAVSSVCSRSRKSSRAYSKNVDSEGKSDESEGLQLISQSTICEELRQNTQTVQTVKYKQNGEIVYDSILSESNVKDSMRIKDIMPYVDLDKMTYETFSELCDALKRAGGVPRTPARLEAQYGDELGDIAIEQARLELDRTRAETAKLRAQAADDLADASETVLEALHLRGRPLATPGSRHTTRV